MTKLTVKMQTLKFLIWIRFNVDFDVNFLCELFAKRRIQMMARKVYKLGSKVKQISRFSEIGP